MGYDINRTGAFEILERPLDPPDNSLTWLEERAENTARVNDRARTRTAESVLMSRKRITEIDSEIRGIRSGAQAAIANAERAS